MRGATFRPGDLVMSRHTYEVTCAMLGASRAIMEGDVGLCVGLMRRDREAWVLFGTSVYEFWVGSLRVIA